VGSFPLQARRKLLNAEMREFEGDYAARDTRSDGRYVLTRDLATYAITKEVEAGRGTPAAAPISASSMSRRTKYAEPSGPSSIARRQRHRISRINRSRWADRALPHGRNPRG